jgi:acetyl-CoA carboxylase carboxyltransferase component
MVSAVSNSTVPKFSIIMGNSYGAGNYAMCGKAYDPRLIVAWPSAKISVMGGEQAAKVLMQIQVASMKSQGKEPTAKEQQDILDKISQQYDNQTSPYYAAARLWLDAIIDPVQTRSLISAGIAAADHAPIEKFNVGVIQT